MAYLTSDQILKIEDLDREEVEVPEWGGSVFVRMMRGDERDSFELEVSGKNGSIKSGVPFRASLCARCMVDENNNRLFKDGQIKQLSGKSAAALQRIFNVATRLNGFSSDDVEELEGNSKAAH